MRKLFNVKALAIFVSFMAGLFVSTTMNAQGTDFFFRVDNDDIYNNRDEEGITIEGMNHENPIAPLGSGLLVMVAAGAGYALSRSKKLRKSVTVLVAVVLLLGMTQCKKEMVSNTEDNKIFVTLEASNGRTVFLPSTAGFNWNNGTEYVYVGGSTTGYLGQLSAMGTGNDSQINRIVFSGEITAPTASETIYFFYLGNASRTFASGTATTVIDFSHQPDGSEATVTNLLIAIAPGELEPADGNSYIATTDLRVKTAIAYFRLSNFKDANNADETIYLHGDDVFSSATINFKEGTVLGNDKGNINVGTNGEKYVALIKSTDASTVLNFDSNSASGKMTFPEGIRERTFYSDETAPLPVAAADLPEGVLPGLFSVSATKMVRFSKGNLKFSRASLNDDWSTGTWSFMENQYDIVEKTNEAIEENYANKTTISLFGWGCTGEHDVEFYDQQMYYMPYNTDAVILYQGDYYSVDDNYGPTGIDWSTYTVTAHGLSVANHSDWGWCIGGEDSPWRTLTGNEWSWLLGINNGKVGYSPNPGVNCRTSSTIGSTDNARYTKAKIITANETVYGWVVFPDVYEHPSTAPTLAYINYQDTNATTWECDVIQIEAWNAMEAAGAVFLPAAGTRVCLPNSNTVSINSVGYDLESGNNDAGGNYWSSSPNSYAGTRILNFDHKRSLVHGGGRANGASVRLVRDAGSSN